MEGAGAAPQLSEFLVGDGRDGSCSVDLKKCVQKFSNDGRHLCFFTSNDRVYGSREV